MCNGLEGIVSNPDDVFKFIIAIKLLHSTSRCHHHKTRTPITAIQRFYSKIQNDILVVFNHLALWLHYTTEVNKASTYIT